LVRTKGIERTSQNWKGAIGAVPAKYKAGIQGAQNWQANAVAAEELWAAKVAEAAANRTRAKKLSQVSDSEWKQRASELGSARIASGMTAAEGKFRKGMADVLSTIEATSIGERTADPMANIDARVKPIAKALYDMKRK